MRNTTVSSLGWVAAAACAGLVLAGGFQGAAEKTGIVDISKVIEQSDFGKANQETFNQMKASREGVLEFIDTYKVLTNDQAMELRRLSLLPAPKPEEKAALDKLRNDIIEAKKRYDALVQKNPPTDDERKVLTDFGNRSANMNELAQQWFRQFTQEMQTWADKQKASSVDRARAAINEVGKAQGYTVVFEAGVAPYGANDITDAALKAMNAKK